MGTAPHRRTRAASYTRDMPTATPIAAPRAADSPVGSRFLLVYDGDCGFCAWTLELLRRWLPSVPAAVDGRRADLLALGLDEDDVDYSSWLLELDGERAVHYGGMEGFAQLLRRQPSWPWRLAGNVLQLPGIRELGHAGYEWVARNRHRMPHGTASCAA